MRQVLSATGAVVAFGLLVLACAATAEVASTVPPTPTPVPNRSDLVQVYVAREPIDDGVSIGELLAERDRFLMLADVPVWDVQRASATNAELLRAGFRSPQELAVIRDCKVDGPLTAGQPLTVQGNDLEVRQMLAPIADIPAGTSAATIAAAPTQYLSSRLVSVCGSPSFMGSVSELQQLANRVTSEPIGPTSSSLLSSGLFVDPADLPTGVSVQPTPTPVPPPGVEVITVAGVVNPDTNEGRLYPTELALRRAADVSTGEYDVELVDADGSLLASQSFSPRDVGNSFNVEFERPAVPIDQIRIVDGDEVVLIKDAPGPPPTIEIQRPAPGERISIDDMTFEWAGASTSTDQLRYYGAFLIDGVLGWTEIASGGSSTSTTQRLFFGGLDQPQDAEIYVAVSDGVNTAISRVRFVLEPAGG